VRKWRHSRRLFAQVNEALAVKPKRTIDEQVARFEKMVAAERGRRKRLRLRRWIPAVAVAAALALAAGLLVVKMLMDVERRPDRVAAPRKP